MCVCACVRVWVWHLQYNFLSHYKTLLWYRQIKHMTLLQDSVIENMAVAIVNLQQHTNFDINKNPYFKWYTYFSYCCSQKFHLNTLPITNSSLMMSGIEANYSIAQNVGGSSASRPNCRANLSMHFHQNMEAFCQSFVLHNTVQCLSHYPTPRLSLDNNCSIAHIHTCMSKLYIRSLLHMKALKWGIGIAVHKINQSNFLWNKMLASVNMR